MWVAGTVGFVSAFVFWMVDFERLDWAVSFSVHMVIKLI